MWALQDPDRIASSEAAGSPAENRRIAVSFRDVCFSYDDKRVLSSVNLDVYERESIVIVGRNGSGKSTLAHHINALLIPDSGQVTIFGKDTSDPANTAEIRRLASMVFQDPDSQIVATIVCDDVAFGPENLGLQPDEIERRIDECLALVGLSAFRDSDSGYLSGGEKQRLAIASAMAMHPSILVLDEAQSMLDPAGRESVMQIIASLNDLGVTTILITHSMDDAAKADRIVVLSDGQVAMQGTPDRIFSHGDMIEELGLEEPFIYKLRDNLAAHGFDLPSVSSEPDLEEAICRLR